MPRALITLRSEPFYRRDAFEQGLRRLGYTIVDKPFAPESRDDLEVRWNIRAGTDEAAAAAFEHRGGTILCAENAYLQMVDKSRYAISTHGHCGAGWFPVGAEDRFSVLGFSNMPRVEHGSYMLVCGQRGVGSAEMRSPPGWGERKTLQLGKHLARFRPHPGMTKPRVPVVEDLSDATICVVWSSTVGVLALTMGVPVMHYAPHWICEEASGQFDEVRVKRALHKMSHGQWAVDEIASGIPFARMRDANWGPAWC